MKNLLISACLLGLCCRYDGQSRPMAGLSELQKRYHLIPVCPEQLGGLPTPRQPSERQGSRVVMRSGEDVTAQYLRGAQEAKKLAELFGCETAVLKARSPSCGSGRIYDGTFTGTLTDGFGLTAELLLRSGVRVISEEEIASLLEEKTKE